MSVWDLKSTFYKFFRSHFLFRLILEKENLKLRKLLAHLPPEKKRVLDIGTGMGNALFFISNEHELFGLDSSFKMLRLAQKRVQAQFIQADAKELPFKSKTFALILAIGFIEYLSTLDRFLNAIVRIMGKDSFLILTLSPPNIFSYLRTLLGHRIYPLRFEYIKMQFEKHGFQIVKRTKSLMQEQYLLKLKM